MSIIDYLMLIGAALIGVIVVLVVLAPIAIVRWWIRRISDEPVKKSAPRVRTRIQQSPDWNGAA